MTQDEIIEMARQSGFDWSGKELTWEDVICTEELEAFAKLVAETERKECAEQYLRIMRNAVKDAVDNEREACAKICDAEQKKNEDNGQWLWEAKICGIAIRARQQA